jgi:pilus assembly protein CpaB
MNRRRLFMIGVLALTIGLFASLLVYRNLAARSVGRSPLMDVMVAAKDIPFGVRLQDADIRIAKLPVNELPDNIFHSRAEVIGRTAVQNIAKGDLLLPGKLAGANSPAGMASMIPEGMRAVPVRVSDLASIAGFLGSGSRVDVLSTGTAPGSNQQVTRTVLQNVEVLSGGGPPQRTGDPGPGSPVVTLLVTPDEARVLTVAATDGRLQLALRNPRDAGKDAATASQSTSLFPLRAAAGGSGEAVPAATPAKGAPAKGHRSGTSVKPPPTTYGVELIQGVKRDVAKFPE